MLPPRVPLVDLAAAHEPLREPILEALARCLDAQRFILGEEVERLERGIAELCEVSHAVGVSSGTDALLVSLMALGVGPGDEIVTTPFSFFATAGVVVRLGAVPVFADIEDRSFGLDARRVAEVLTTKTRAILPVHLYGQCADVPSLERWAAERGVPIVEDAAQAIGARLPDGRRAGAAGRLAAVSFYPSKNLGALGDAGVVVTSDRDLADRVRRLRHHGQSHEYRHETVGGNFRIDALQAAVLNVKLPHVEAWNEARRRRAQRYDELFHASGLVERGEVTLPSTVRGEHVFHQYVVRAARRDELREHLARDGVATAVYYPLPLHLQPCFRGLGYSEGDFPVSERASRETLALPMYPQLRDDQQRIVVDSVRSFFFGA